MKIAITGPTGHVGVNLVKELSKNGYTINVLIFNGDCIHDYPNVKKVYGSLQNIDSLNKLCNGVDVVFHLASLISIGFKSYKQILSTNVEGTKNVLTAAKKAGVKKFIHFSSIHALVHEPFNLPMDESRKLAINSKIHYEKTKAIAEQWVLKNKDDNMSVVVINPTSIIGPADPKPSHMGEYMKMVYQGKTPGLIPGGYDWVDVRDIIDATIAAIDKGKDGERYILSGSWLSIYDFTNIFVELCDKKRKLRILPLWLARLAVPFMLIYAKLSGRQPVYTNESLTILQSCNQLISSKKAQKDLGFVSRPINETIMDTYNWYKENNYF